MRNSIVLICFFLVFAFSCKEKSDGPRVLVFSKTSGYRHESIETGKLALIKLGEKHGFKVDTTEDASRFNEDTLKRYAAVIFLSTTQNVLDPVQQGDFKRYIEAGGGFVGIHAAADTEYEWPWFGKLVGAYFKSHPHIQQAKMKKVRPFGPNTLPDEWVRTDEWYNYKHISKDINVIYTLDESSYQGGQNGQNHPIAWYHEFSGGRAFYTGLGHTNESYSDSLFLEHVRQGIEYAMGEKKQLNYDAVKTKRTPEENRFTKTVLDFNLNEPTEMTILPDGRIIFVERKGDIKLYSPETNKISVINRFKPWTKFEDGLIGLTADPDFSKNNFLYLFYSHPQRSANVLSRFVFKNDSLDLSSEKELLEVKTQRDHCCHTGGSLQFSKDRILFVSTGDNTNPHLSNGYSPSDERPAQTFNDAQRTSANTNDLRGKILRIRVNEDGTYSIPEGNLFPKGEAGTRPEIFVMGNRNPYRISVDRAGTLYWGEVGPDAGNNDSLRGPRGYDEINVAKKAGFYGWPYFIGNNIPYADFNFQTNVAGKKYDPEHPFNDSPNNTGKNELPPAQPALIYYPYDKSDEFPMVRDGGRNAMAGPIFYSDQFQNVETAFPDYMDGKVLIYDWMRNWMFLLSLDEQGGILDMEPFMEHTKFNNIIDMAYGPDGRLYMLEYGTAWFQQNMDARLVRIDYNGGNRAPIMQLAADKNAGALPLQVTFTADGSLDYDGDKISYELTIGDKNLTSNDGRFSHTFDKPGVYDVKLVGKDPAGQSGQASLKITAGNALPEIDIRIVKGNQTFYFPGVPVSYEVVVRDIEDGSSESGQITDAKVSFNFIKGLSMQPRGHQSQIPEHPGKALMDNSDCKSCHLLDKKSAGPGYKEIAAVYKNKPGSVDKLAERIIRGGAGVWGTVEMSAHPQMSIQDAKQIVEYIFTLGDDKKQTLPLKGTVTPGNETDGGYILTATYSDRGGNQVPSLSNTRTLTLSTPALQPDKTSELSGPRPFEYQGRKGLENVRHNSYSMYRQIDLTGVASATADAFVMPNQQVGGQLELRIGKPDGEVIAQFNLTGQGMNAPSVKVKPQTGFHDVYLVFKNPQAGNKQLFMMGEVRLHPK